MLANDDSSDEDSDGSNDNDASTQRLRSISGDDLGDSFAHDEEPKTKLGWIEDILRKENEDVVESEDGTSSEGSESAEDDGDEDEIDEDDDECEKTRSLKDWEQSDDDIFDTDLEVGGGEEEDDHDVEEDNESKGHKKVFEIKQRQLNLLDSDKAKANSKQLSTQQEDLPYTIEAPKSLEELSLLLKDRSESQIIEAIRRIRTFNAITVAAENRKKMQVCTALHLL